MFHAVAGILIVPPLLGLATNAALLSLPVLLVIALFASLVQRASGRHAA